MRGIQAVLTSILLASFAGGHYTGDSEMYERMVTTFGKEQFELAIASMFHIDSDVDGITGKIASNRSVRVLELLEILLPSFVKNLLGSRKNVWMETNNPLNFLIDNFTVNLEDKEFEIGTGKYDNITIIPSFLILGDVTVLVRFGIDLEAESFSDRFKLQDLGIAGVWRLKDVGGLTFHIRKVGDEFTFRGAPESGSLNVGKFAQDMAASVLPSGGLQVVLKRAGLDKFSIEKAQFVGISNNNGFAMGLSGSPTIEGWGSFRSHLILHRYKEQPWQKAETVLTIGINFPSFRLSSLIQKITANDITHVPFFGSLTIPEIGLVVSTGNVDPDMVPGVLDGILAQLRPIHKGVAIILAIPLVEDRAPVQCIIHLSKDDMKFSLNDPGVTLTLKNLIKVILPNFNVSRVPLPPGVSGLLNLQLYSFEYVHKTKTISVELRFGEKLVLIENIVSILNPTLNFEVSLSEPRKTTVKAHGKWQLGTVEFPISLKPHPVSDNSEGEPGKTKGYLLTAKFPEINIGNIINKFSVTFLPSSLQSILARVHLTNFSIQEPFISIPIGVGSSDFRMQFSGRPVIGSWSGVTLNAIVIRTNGEYSLALGIEFKNVQFASLVEKLSGVQVSWISFLDRSLSCAFVISPKSIEGVSLQGALLGDVPVEKGLTIVAFFQFPQNCEGNQFCEFMKNAIGANATMRLRSTISSFSQFTFAAGVANIKLGDGLTLSEAGIEFKIGSENSIGLVATLKLVEPKLTFKGAIRLGTEGLVMEMSMEGIWKNAFGIEWLAFGNVHIKVAIKPGVVPGLALGGEIQIGKIDSGNEIVCKAHAGFDPINPANNYFYGFINKLTIGAILAAFDKTATLPRALRESGFPTGLEASYSLTEREVPGVTIPAGFRLKGSINIVGYTLSCDIAIDLPKLIKIDIKSSSLRLANGLLIMSRSVEELDKGPMFYANIKFLPSPSVELKAAGYVNVADVLGSGGYLEFSSSQFEVRLYGRFFLFDASLRVYANYGSLANASFAVAGSLSTAWMAKLEQEVKETIDAAGRKADALFQNASQVLSKTKAALKAAASALKEKQCDVDSANVHFDNVVRDLEKAQAEVDDLCHLKSCKDGKGISSCALHVLYVILTMRI